MNQKDELAAVSRSLRAARKLLDAEASRETKALKYAQGLTKFEKKLSDALTLEREVGALFNPSEALRDLVQQAKDEALAAIEVFQDDPRWSLGKALLDREEEAQKTRAEREAEEASSRNKLIRSEFPKLLSGQLKAGGKTVTEIAVEESLRAQANTAQARVHKACASVLLATPLKGQKPFKKGEAGYNWAFAQLTSAVFAARKRHAQARAKARKPRKNGATMGEIARVSK